MVWVLEAGEEARSPASLPPPSPTFEIALRKLQREEEGWLQKIDKANFWNHTNRLAGSPGGGARSGPQSPHGGDKKGGSTAQCRAGVHREWMRHAALLHSPTPLCTMNFCSFIIFVLFVFFYSIVYVVYYAPPLRALACTRAHPAACTESNPGSDYSLHRGREYEKLIQMR